MQTEDHLGDQLGVPVRAPPPAPGEVAAQTGRKRIRRYPRLAWPQAGCHIGRGGGPGSSGFRFSQPGQLPPFLILYHFPYPDASPLSSWPAARAGIPVARDGVSPIRRGSHRAGTGEYGPPRWCLVGGDPMTTKRVLKYPPTPLGFTARKSYTLNCHRKTETTESPTRRELCPGQTEP